MFPHNRKIFFNFKLEKDPYQFVDFPFEIPFTLPFTFFSLLFGYFQSRARDSISHSVGRSVGPLVGRSVGRSLFTKHATYGDRPCYVKGRESLKIVFRNVLEDPWTILGKVKKFYEARTFTLVSFR